MFDVACSGGRFQNVISRTRTRTVQQVFKHNTRWTFCMVTHQQLTSVPRHIVSKPPAPTYVCPAWNHRPPQRYQLLAADVTACNRGSLVTNKATKTYVKW